MQIIIKGNSTTNSMINPNRAANRIKGSLNMTKYGLERVIFPLNFRGSDVIIPPFIIPFAEECNRCQILKGASLFGIYNMLL
jgi:hypothetical protein